MTVTPNSAGAGWDEGSAAQPALEPVTPPRGRRLRWVVAAVASALVVGLISVVLILANPPAQGGVSALARFAPADSVMYVEARLDLPGDQRDQLIAFLRHFPGFADAASFDRKINDTIDQLLTGSDSEFSWSADIEPWFGGQLVAFASQLEEDGPQAGVIALSVKDRAALDRFVERERGLRQYTASEHRGATVLTRSSGVSPATIVALDDVLLLAEQVEDAHAALDAAAGERARLIAAPRFEQAMSRLHGSRLLALYLDGEAMFESLDIVGSEIVPPEVADQLRHAPGTMVGQLRVEAEHLLFEMRLAPRAGEAFPDLPQNRSTTLAASFGANLVGYGEVRDVGQGIRQFVSQYGSLLGAGAEPLPVDVDQLLGGSLEDFFDFLGDAAVGVEIDGERVGGGVVALLTDEDVARQRIERLVSSLRMLLAFGGSDVPLSIDEETHGGVSVTVVRVRDQSAEIPFASVSWAVANGRFYLGIDDFVGAALDRGTSAGLAGDARYRAALAAAGESNAGLLYLDMARLRTVVEAQLSPRELDQGAELWPYFERFAQVMATVSTDGDDLVTRFLLFVE